MDSQLQEETEKLKKAISDYIAPVDFEALIKAGAIKKEGTWYRILNMDLLPDQFMKKASRLISDKKGTKVKLQTEKKIESFKKRILKNKNIKRLLA